jgi:hypothetical protein
MARLDAEEAWAHQTSEPERLSPPEVVDYLRSLPRLWADSGPEGRQALATAIFKRTDVLGFERLEYELTPDAIALGMNAALPPIIEFGEKREFGRGERI